MTVAQNRVNEAQLLLDYTVQILDQTSGIVTPYQSNKNSTSDKSASYGAQVGGHIRHIVEHYEALTTALALAAWCAGCKVDYDARARDPLLETDPSTALTRIAALQRALRSGCGVPARQALPVEIHTRGGLEGEYNFRTMSTLARELSFLNSHAVHHFAILQGYAKLRGESLGAGLGRAPSTIAHENKLQRQAGR